MIFPGVHGYHDEISKSSFQHRKLSATWGSAGPAAQLARCSGCHLRGRGTRVPQRSVVGRGAGEGGSMKYVSCAYRPSQCLAGFDAGEK